MSAFLLAAFAPGPISVPAWADTATLDATGFSDTAAPPVSPDSLEWAGRAALRLGHHAKARPLFEKALEIETHHSGADHPKCVPALCGLAEIESIEGEFAESMILYKRALRIARGAFSPTHPVLVDAVIGYARVLGYLGDYLAAEETLRPCFDAVTAAHGDEDDRSIRLMLTRGRVLRILGRDVESTLLYRRAAAAAEKVYDGDHVTRALALSGLAHTYRRVGQGLKARALYRRCIEIVEKIHGSPHPDLVHYRCRLGMSLFEGDRWSDEALASIERGISEAAELYGAESYQVALEQRQLGLLRMGRIEWAEAVSVFESCLPTLESCFGPDHPALSKALKGIAWSYFNLGRTSDALVNIEHAVSLYEDTRGHDRYELTYLLNMKTFIELGSRRFDDAFATSRRAVEMAIGVQEENLQISSTRDAILYATRPCSSTQGLVTAAVAHPHLSLQDWGSVLSFVSRTHGSVLDWLAERHRLLKLSGPGSQLRQANDAVEKASQHLANLIVNGPGEDTAAYFEDLAAASRNVEESEQTASSMTEELRVGSDFAALHRKVSFSSLCDALEPGMTLVHFLTFFKIVDSPPNTAFWRLPHYAAFRLSKRNDGGCDLDFLDLGTVTSVDSLVAGYRSSINSVGAGRRPSARNEAEYCRFASLLYGKLWKPLFPEKKKGADTGIPSEAAPLVLIVPDARLYEVDFNTLLSPEGTLVIEGWKTHILSSAVDLLETPATGAPGRGMLAAGNPARKGESTLMMESGGNESGRPDRVFCIDAVSATAPLPGAEREAAAISSLYALETGESTVLLSGPQATETRVKNEIVGKRIVHFAVHGFLCDKEAMSERANGDAPIDPLLMTGLVLAQDRLSDDGLLTAQEVACLDLTSVDWVVLSACGSGLGRVVFGEGMFGLRRAFEIAGARTVLMALWQLSDTGTSRFMQDIYALRLAGASTVDAIREVELGYLYESRRRFNRIHPSLWGGIISEGDWR